MAEIYKKLKPVQVDYICDTCGEGELKPTGAMKLSYPPLYTHKCSKCNEVFDLKKTYPSIEYITE